MAVGNMRASLLSTPLKSRVPCGWKLANPDALPMEQILRDSQRNTRTVRTEGRISHHILAKGFDERDARIFANHRRPAAVRNRPLVPAPPPSASPPRVTAITENNLGDADARVVPCATNLGKR